MAFVYDPLKTLDSRVNHDMVELMEPTDAELEEVRALIQEHVERTKSPRGIKLLYQYEDIRRDFVKVISPEYRAVIERQRLQQEQ